MDGSGGTGGKKAVTFKPTCTVRILHPRHEYDDDDAKSRLYYSRREMHLMNLEANALCALSRRCTEDVVAVVGTHLDRRDSVIIGEEDGTSIPSSSHSSSHMSSSTRDIAIETDTPRGLEMALYPARYRMKRVAIRSFLRYQASLDTRGGGGGDAMNMISA
ncbi:hypothetical protein ACHAXA_000755 [Cyclostephanos tholiformis]|uniref:Uncharacterized protein n=1 Tax=Cyclostephanos tholiformis TaxID=382380 RepID=A0ABD3RR59_9STRA